jgi:hypothetical protein
MALLTGMTEDGREVPVQVDANGRLVAEGLRGPAGADAPSYWDRSGTEISTKTAGDSVFTAGAVKVGGTTASPSITLGANGGDILLGGTLPASPNITLKADGKIGVGTAAPANSFHAVGTSAELVAGFQNWGGFAKFGVSAAGNAVAGAVTPSQAFELWAGNAEKARITGAGDFLLGGTLPSAPNITLQADGKIASGLVLGLGRPERFQASGSYLAFGDSEGYTVINAAGHIGASLLAGAGTNGNARLDLHANSFEVFSGGSVRELFTPTGDFLLGGTLPASPNITLSAAGNINSKGAVARVYADNAAAIAAGLAIGDIYRKADGTLMITF